MYKDNHGREWRALGKELEVHSNGDQLTIRAEWGTKDAPIVLDKHTLKKLFDLLPRLESSNEQWTKIGDLVARRDDSDAVKFVQVADEGDGSTILFDESEARGLMAMFNGPSDPPVKARGVPVEYTTRWHPESSAGISAAHLQNQANEMALQGWTLVTHTTHRSTGQVIATYKRKRSA